MTTYLKGSQGEAMNLVVCDEDFRARAMAFAKVREELFRELSRAETGHHEMRGSVRCIETSRLGRAEWKNHPGYLTAWFALRSFRVRLGFVAHSASLDAFEARNPFFDNGRQCTVGRVENVERIGFAWTAQNPVFWEALALVRETPHAQLCGVCLEARVKMDGSTCGCEHGDGMTIMLTST
jgi:hypothetical protein